MKYDFTTLLNRKGHDALALDVLPIKDVEVDPNFFYNPYVGCRYELSCF